ncbi:MAG TPA: 2,3-dihydro-2,3-dihydroxybenzoate dehydrogenase [Tahibacter sp.]|uniref:2,3-dihydro-2,3-dihydroxybenzoate dehydrogenase n=1 Tax=Tahibacter sp. TaxID=2056211 RepID=UPI002C8751DD|nr:2,3-dihydro-2,3-dihydroxybenzoate dehydrogenase [Tahibacter sp.]HSX61718.1 2,3-dihydro-2,3-dihydroxybenzoate dehydrogenase [Tahibacter sp.]
MNFAGQRVWVTGAGQGIGRRIAERFLGAGADVVGLDRRFDAPFGGTAIELDIADAARVAAVCAGLFDAAPRLDVLVHAAGVLRLGAVDELDEADWRACVDTNAGGAFHLLRAVVPVFKRQRGGAIVCVGSNAARVPRLGMAAYCASKAALVSLSHCAALELAPYGVRCNLVSPGSTDTPMLRGMWSDEEGRGRTIAGDPASWRLGIPLNKIASVDDVANAVLFLASDLAGHVTMHDLVVDGGASLAA